MEEQSFCNLILAHCWKPREHSTCTDHIKVEPFLRPFKTPPEGFPHLLLVESYNIKASKRDNEKLVSIQVLLYILIVNDVGLLQHTS